MQQVLFIDEWIEKVHEWHTERGLSIATENYGSEDFPSDNHDYQRMFTVQGDGSLKVGAYLCWKCGHFIALDYDYHRSCGNCDVEGVPWWGKVIAPEGIIGPYLLAPDWQQHIYVPFRQNSWDILTASVTNEEKKLAEAELGAFSHQSIAV